MVHEKASFPGGILTSDGIVNSCKKEIYATIRTITAINTDSDDHQILRLSEAVVVYR
ncbi:uncharacterized protein METZ01_LOCUS209999 [marine metagenome]|uniref:Uncharacterized protein n=1 Tax=marine metagenome TaxID=408172 RepID=A0A382F370_9ZZZZ